MTTLRTAAQQALEAICSCGPQQREAAAALRAALAEQRSDGMPSSSDERHLRRLLAARVGMPNTYYDDGEAHGVEYGINIDFMREPVADIDAKLRALNVARAALAGQPAEQEPVAVVKPNGVSGVRVHIIGDVQIGDELYTAPQPAKQPLIADEICDFWEFITGHQIQFGPSSEGRPMYLSTDEVIEFARAIERAHGITGEQN